MIQRVDTEERLVYTAHDLSRILEWHNQGLYFDIYSRKDASCE
jgi:hypothetical protein